MTLAYTLDSAGNVTSEAKNGATTRSYTYVAQQLRTLTEGTSVEKYFYTPEGNLSCVTNGSGVEEDCLLATGVAPAATVLEAYAYD